MRRDRSRHSLEQDASQSDNKPLENYSTTDTSDSIICSLAFKGLKVILPASTSADIGCTGLTILS